MLSYKVFLSLIIATIAASFASILVRLSSADALIIVFYRLTFATILMTIGAEITNNHAQLKKIPAIPKQDQWQIVLSGFFLAIHFATWTMAVQNTSVASAVVLGGSAQIFVLLLSIFLLGERSSRQQILGILISVLGGIIIALGDMEVEGAESLVGDVLAIIGAVSIAIYLVIGRNCRQNYDLFTYVTPVYGICAIFLFIYALLAQQALIGLNWEEYVLFFLLALGPSCLGHTLFNYALKEASAPLVAVVLLGEPIGASLLAIVILNEFPHLFTVVGGIGVLLGITICVVYEQARVATNNLSK
ncbi:MAG: DMT family transporter [Promethearchaeota archaeon]